MRFEDDAASSSNQLLERFFTGLSEYAFYSQLGVTDTELVTYVSSLLIRFTKTDALHRIRQLNGRRATEVVTMMTEAQRRIGMARREVHRHIGDFTLFWTGLYPESLRGLQATERGDQFVSYCQEGKKAYEIASEIETDDETEASNSLLHRLSDQFEMCAYGLREIRRQWEERPDSDVGIVY
ncbi:MAG: hypothetical protein KGQ60_19430 [Planctomycetes bacterium]|nr:hypothetical protein [Planctomycetota bacterium]